MDPTSIATGGFGAGTKLSGGAGGASGAVTTTTNTKSGFDNSGWTVGSGSSKVSATAGLSPWIIAGIAAAGLAAVWIIYRKK